MKKWIEFNLNHPRVIFILILLITIAASYGLSKLHFDSSTEALLPREDRVYRISQRAKKVFGDNKTFMMAAFESTEGKELLSHEILTHIDKLITELEEFKNFNRGLEDERLETIISLGNIETIRGKSPDKSDQVNSASIKNEMEDELDAEILGENSSSSVKTAADKNKTSSDIWDLTRELKKDFFALPIRERNKYIYDNYSPISLARLRDELDPGAVKQLQTILITNKMEKLPENHPLSEKEFRSILEKWETSYLYKSMEIIKTLMDPISGEDILGTENELLPVKMLPLDSTGKRIIPNSREEFAIFKEKLQRNPSFESLLYSRGEGKTIEALAMNMELRPLEDHGEIFKYLYDVIMKYNNGPVKITPAGMPVYNKFLRDYMENDLVKLIPLVVIVVIISFFMNFRMVRGIVLPTLSVILSTVWTLGLMGYFNVPITLLVNLLPPLLVAVGSSYSIHIFNQYLQDQDLIEKKGKKWGLTNGMSNISATVLLAALTTFIGFMTLSTNQLTSLKDFGIFAAIGTLLAMLVSIMLIPSALMMMRLLPAGKKNKSGKAEHTNIVVRKLIDSFAWLSLKHPGPTVAITGIVIAICIVGITRLETETSHMHYFHDDSFLYQSDLYIGRMFKGTLVMNLIIDSGSPNGIKDPAFLNKIERIRAHLELPENSRKTHILHTASFCDVIKRMHMAMNSDNPEFFRIPEKRSAVLDYMEIFTGDDRDSDGRIDSLEGFVDTDYRYTNIMIRMGPVNGVPPSLNTIVAAEKNIENFLTDEAGFKKDSWNLAGEALYMIVLSDYIIRGQIRSIVLTLLTISLVIFMLFKNWKASVVAIIPISASIIIIYGFMGFTGIPLDIPKAILAAIAIGIGVDDTIHMLKTLRFNLKKGLPLHDALTIAYKEAGTAIVYTSVALIMGFSMFLLSEFVPIFYFGWLVTATMVSTTFTALVLLPAVIVFFNINLGEGKIIPALRWMDLGRFFDVNIEDGKDEEEIAS